MKQLIVQRFEHQEPYNLDVAFMFAEEIYWSDSKVQKSFPEFQSYWNTVCYSLRHDRLEGYLINGDGEVVAASYYSRVMDIHYGLIAVPITVIVKEAYRGDTKVLRAVSKLIREQVKRLGVVRYTMCHHIDDNTQITRMRTI